MTEKGLIGAEAAQVCAIKIGEKKGRSIPFSPIDEFL